MKQKGYILVFVVLVLALLGTVAIYSMERMRLAIMIEENRITGIREQAELHSALAYLLEAANEHETLNLLRTHLLSGKSHTAATYDTTLRFPDSGVQPAKMTISTPDQQLSWSFTTGAGEQTYTAEQYFMTPYDTLAKDGGPALSEKIIWTLDALHKSGKEVLVYERDLLIKLTQSPKKWEIYEMRLSDPQEPAETEPLDTQEDPDSGQEDATGDPADPVTVDPPDDPSSETGPDPAEEPVTEEAITEEAITEEPVTEAPRSEPEPVPHGPIHTIPLNKNYDTAIICTGNLFIDGTNNTSSDDLYGILILKGELSIKNVAFRGVVLHEGSMKPADKKGNIAGFYESDHAGNLAHIHYDRSEINSLCAGMDLPGFFSIRTRGVFLPPPEQFEDP